MNLSKSRQSISSMKYECQVKWIIFTGLYKSQTGYIAKYFTLLKKLWIYLFLKRRKCGNWPNTLIGGFYILQSKKNKDKSSDTTKNGKKSFQSN